MLDVLCAGFACLDLTLRLPHHPAPDEKLAATGLVHSGGGPAANAAVQIARLGGRAGFLGRLGDDVFGHDLLARFAAEGVDTSACMLTSEPTPLAVVLTKPDGSRNALGTRPSAPPLIDPVALLSRLNPKVLLLDAHRPEWTVQLAAAAHAAGIPVVADLGSPTPAAQALAQVADHLVASETYAAGVAPAVPGRSADNCAGDGARYNLSALSATADKVTIMVTLGERGLIYRHPEHGSGSLPAFKIEAVDTNGAGDAFHGAYALGLARGLPWVELIRRASAAGALACTRHGSWTSLANATELENFLLQADTKTA